MKRFLHKKWLSIPVIAALVLILAAGSVLAAYGFFQGTLNVEVMEAIAIGTFDTWDNLEPYGSVDDVNITIGEDGITIVHSAETPYVGEGFCPGEWIVIPVNIRNGSDGALTLSASASGGGDNFDLTYLWKTNTGTADEDGYDFGFIPTGTWASLSQWNPTVAGHSGESGSAKVGATVLFVRVSVSGDAIPTEGDDLYTVTVTLYRE